MGPPMRWGFEDTKKPNPYGQDRRWPPRPGNRHPRDHRQPQNYKDHSANQHRGADKFGKHGNNSSNQNKRPHSTAFGKHQNQNMRVPAPPPVPSFGNPLPSKPPAPVDGGRKPKKKKRRHNQLGLTPHTEEHESSEEEDDADEEAKLAQALAVQPDQLRFSYKGQTSTLKSSSDIAAWLKERRDRFPTRARIEAKNKEAAEKKRVANEAKRQKDIAVREQKERDEEERKQAKRRRVEKEKEKLQGKGREEDNNDPKDAAMRAKMKAEKLRRRLIKEEKRIARAEANAEKARLMTEGVKEGANGDSRAESTGHENKTALVVKDQEDGANGTGETPAVAGHIKPEDKVDGSEEADTKPAEVKGEERSNIDGASGNTTDTNMEEVVDGSDDDISISSSSSEPSSDSSCSSDTDESSSEGGDGPEALSSKRQGPERVPPPPRQAPKKAKACRDFLRGKRCLRGENCTFSHDLPERGAKAGAGEKKRERKGLLQAVSHVFHSLFGGGFNN